MNAHSTPKLSLIERAAQVYDFEAVLRRRDVALSEKTPPAAEPTPRPTPEPRPTEYIGDRKRGIIDRAGLEERGFVLPDAPVGPLAEELRIVKRGVLSTVRSQGSGKGQIVMVCSARPDDGKTFTAVNLGLSLASERDTDVLLIDGDIAKPEILSTLGLEGGAGLIDALTNPALDPESLVIETDIPGLSVLSAGRQAHNATELLASERMAEILAALTLGHSRRILLFDSPPALAASAASAIASHAGQVVMVVRADRTTEADLQDAVGLMSGCGEVRLVLNGAAYSSGGKRFSYYGAGL